MSKKYHVIRGASLDQHFTEIIRQQLGMYIAECKQNRQDAARNVNISKNKPWVPRSNYNFKISAVKRGMKKTVAVFDPCTSMVTKQYTSMHSAGTAAIMMEKNGNEAEIPVLTINSVKLHIHKSAQDPSLLLYGYRWMFLDDIRSGNFALSAKKLEDATVRKICTVSETTLAEFESIENAHKDWLEFKKIRKAVLDEKEEDDTIHYFDEKFVNGNDNIDGIVWQKIEPKSGDIVKVHVQEEEPVKDANEDTMNNNDKQGVIEDDVNDVVESENV